MDNILGKKCAGEKFNVKLTAPYFTNICPNAPKKN